MNDEEMKHQPSHAMDEDENDSIISTACPLFMEGLPTNFQQNSQLSAIASLLEENVREEVVVGNVKKEPTRGVYQCVLNRRRHKKKSQNQHTKPMVVKKKSSGTKLSAYKKKNHRSKGNSTKKLSARRKSLPSSVAADAPSNKPTSTPSIGEATLFLNMWKL